MKFSHEFSTEDQARAREEALKASGYASWSTHKADGAWQVFWVCSQNQGESQTGLNAYPSTRV